MCELMTIAAALVFTVLYFVGRSRGRTSPAVFTTMLMFWGAALMWSVDCVFNAVFEEKPLFDISRKDTILGFIILGAGLLVFGALSLKERLSAVRA